jgi:hypothetical protein
MRFAVSHVLDAIERRSTIDPLVAGGVASLDEIVHADDIDGGRRPSVLRFGLVVDALARYLADSTVGVYPVVSRTMLSDIEMISNERMAVRRWADDGLVEVLPADVPVADRVREVSALLGIPALGRDKALGDHRLGLEIAGGKVNLTRTGSRPPRLPFPAAVPAMGRRWICPEHDCASFGPRRTGAQPPPRLAGGRPTCPRHGAPLADVGSRQPARAMVARVSGVARHRFPLIGGTPVVVGRAPEAAGGIKLGPHLSDGSRRRISRSHVRLELTPDGIMVTDLSTNGTAVMKRNGPDEAGKRVTLAREEPYQLGDWETVVLHEGVELGRSGFRWSGAVDTTTASVMAEAPTIAMQIPRS